MHEQSETVQNKSGKWINVYGKNTPKAGQQLPDTPEYGTVEEAVAAAKARSEDYGHSHPGPANLGSGPIQGIDVSKGVEVDPRTGQVSIKAPADLGSKQQKPVTSQSIDPTGGQPAPAEDPDFEARLAREREQGSTGSVTDVGEVAVGTPEQNMPATDLELEQGSRLTNPRQYAGPARRSLTNPIAPAMGEVRPNEQSTSEAVRDPARRAPMDANQALLDTIDYRLRRVGAVATGKEKGVTGMYGRHIGLGEGSPVLDAVLEAASLPGDISGDMLAKGLKDAGVDPDVAEQIGFGARIVGGVIYGAKAPILLGAPEALGRYAKELGLFGKDSERFATLLTGVRGQKNVSDLTGRGMLSANDLTQLVRLKDSEPSAQAAAIARLFSQQTREARYDATTTTLHEGLRASDGATVDPRTGAAVTIAPEQAAVSVVPGRSKVIEGDATPAQLREFTKKNSDLLEAYPELKVGAWKDKDTGRTHLDLSVVTTPEQAMELGKANRQKSIFLGTGESVRVPHTYSIEEGAKGHGYIPAERMRPEDVAIAKEYDAAPTMDPEAVPAWRELIDRVRQEVETEILPKLQVEHVNGQPYSSAEEMNRDIAAGRLKVSVDNSDHPVWTQDENVLFRIWHDYKQHFENGADFSLEGEWRAFKTSEVGMSPQARQALQVEIYGQAAAAVAHSGEFQVQKIYLPGKKYPEAQTIADQLAALRREQVTTPHSAIADTLEAHGASILADEPKGIPVYHGTPAVFERADMTNGLWVAEDPSTANRYSGGAGASKALDSLQQAGGAPNVRPYYLDPSAKMMDGEQYHALLNQHGYDAAPEVNQMVIGQGYDGVAFAKDATGKGQHYLVFNPNALTEKFTGKTAAVMAMVAGAAAAQAALSGEDQGSNPALAMAIGAAAMKGKGRGASKLLARAEYLAKEAKGNMRYLVRPIDWASVPKNSKEVGALAAVGASMFARGEVKTPAELMLKLSERFGPGILKHSDVIPKKATKWYEDTLKAIDLRPVEEVLGYFRKGAELPDWYSSGERVKAVFGPDADLVAGLIASTSAHNSNERSVEAALHIYAAYKTGAFDPAEAGSVRKWLENEMKVSDQFSGWSMDTHFNNVERTFLGQEISGNKVWNYKRAILGDENAVVIDSHMVNTLLPDLKKLAKAKANGEEVPDWVTEVLDESEATGKGVDWGKQLNKDYIYKYFEDQVRDMARDWGVTPRFAQQAIWVGKVGAEGRVAESVTPLVDMFKDVAKARGYDSMFPGISDEDTKGLAVLGIATGLIAASTVAEGGVTPDHIEAAFPGAAGNAKLVKVLVDAVRALRGVPGKVKEILPAGQEIALDVLTRPATTIKAGDKLLGLDWVGMSKDADHLPQTIKTVREAFEEAIRADSRGVVSHQMERDMAETLISMGYDPELAVAKWRGGDRSVVSTEIMATAALTKQAYAETDRLARIATKLEGAEAGARAMEDYGRQLGVFGSLVQVLDGQAEEAGRALAIFRAMVPEIPAEARAFAKGEMELAQGGLSPMGGKVAEEATSASRQAASQATPSVGAQAAPGSTQAGTGPSAMAAAGKSAATPGSAGARGAFQGPPGPAAVLAAGNQMVARAQQAQAQYLLQMLHAWNQLPKPAQRSIFLRELGKWGLDFIKQVFYDSMLFTFPGQLANTAGNALAVAGEQTSRVIGAGIGAVRHDLLGLGPAGMSLDQITHGSMQGMLDAVGEAFVAYGRSFVTGTPQSRAIMGASQARVPGAITGERIQDLMALAGVQIPNAVYHGVNVLGMTTGMGTRAMLAGDEWMKVVSFRGELRRLGIEAMEKQNLTGQAASAFMAQWLQSPPADAVKAARDYAHYVTYTQPLTGTLAAISTVGHSTVMTPLTPFFDTLVNVMKYDLEWIPGINALVKKSREDLRHMGPRQDQALAKLGVGAAMMAVAYNLYQNGYLTGPGPSDKNLLRTMTEVEKWQPNSFVFTGSDGKKHYVGINRLDPIAFPFAFVAAYGDIAFEALNGRAVSWDTRNEIALSGVHALGEVAMTRNYAQGFQQMLELITAKDVATFNKLQKIGNKIAGQAVPSGVAQVNKSFDEYQRATYSALDVIYSRLPGKSKELYPDVNLAGEDRFKTAALGPDWLSPIPYSEGRPTVVGQALIENQVGMEDVPQSVFGPPPPALVGEETSSHGILLNAKQHYRYKKLAGNELKVPTSDIEPAIRALGYKGELPEKKMGMWDVLTAVVQSKAFQSLPSGPGSAQNKILRGIISGYRRAAAGQLLREDKDLREKFFGKVLDRAETFAGPRARAMAADAIKSMDIDAVLSMTGNE